MMATFDFIIGDDFRRCLETDYHEMNLAIGAGAWKAVHILAGSIIEALLVDTLIGINYQQNDPLRMPLDELIKVCVQQKILSEKAEHFSHAIRTYRNLIHPGRLIRLNEVVDEDGAKIAITLVNIIMKDVTKKKLENYGYTAEQILAKIISDSSTAAILFHLLKETKEHEKKRLLLDVLPKQYIYLTNLDEPVQPTLTSIGTCFRLVFDNSSEETRKKATKQLVKVIKEESEAIASAYESAFFRATDLQYLSSEEMQLVKQHLFSSLSKRASSSLLSLLKAMKGIGDYLEAQDIPLLYEPLVRAYLSPLFDVPEQVIEEFLQNELWRDCHDKISKAVDHYFDSRMRQGRESPSGKARIQELKSYVDQPF